MEFGGELGPGLRVWGPELTAKEALILKLGIPGLQFTILVFRVLGFRVLGFRVLGFRVLGFRVLGFRV